MEFMRILPVEALPTPPEPEDFASSTPTSISSDPHERPTTLLLVTGLALLANKPYRTLVTTQLYLIAAVLKNLATNELLWSKDVK